MRKAIKSLDAIAAAMKYHLVIEQDEDGWFVSEVVELPGCHTQAKSMDDLLKRTKEAIRAYQAEPSASKFVGFQTIEV
jgi:predicted RNase H-like HicB family nuclease